MIGNKVKLVGKSRHGKNRVREQGELWEVVGESDTVNFRTSAPGPFVMLRSLSSPIQVRWVSMQKDPDFMMEVV
jgi:hypothetical protein|tara:strand:+ start:113 stop:334 length:222 start_codon:yes stop_codon:yes gene_type:complete